MQAIIARPINIFTSLMDGLYTHVNFVFKHFSNTNQKEKIQRRNTILRKEEIQGRNTILRKEDLVNETKIRKEDLENVKLTNKINL